MSAPTARAAGSPTAQLRKDVGQLVCVGFGGTTGEGDITRLINEFHFGSVILFRRNVETAEQVATLCHNLRAASPDPLLITVDQEGGPVARLRGITTDFPAMALLGATGDEGLAHAYGSTLGEELTALGIDLSFAPVVDVNTNPDNPVIGSRAFGDDPTQVSRMAAAQIRGMAAAGLLACAKHFPGHGDTVTDSHKGLPAVPHSMERLNAVELAPFRAAIAAGVPAIMTAHVMFPAMDAQRPATLSPAVIDGLLRGRLGFGGVVATDDLEMAAIADTVGVAEAAVMATKAGVDLMVICHREARQIAAWEALLQAAEGSVEMRDRVRQAAARVRAMRASAASDEAAPAGEVTALLRQRAAMTLAAQIQRRGQQALDDAGAAIARAPDPTKAPELA